MCIYSDKYVLSCVYMRVYEREKCVRMHVYAYIFNLAHMHTLLNLAAVCDCLVLLDDQSVGESSLL